MTNQERLDLEVILRCAAREIIRPYSIHIEDGKLSWEEGCEANYIASNRTTEELKNDFLWLDENIHPNSVQRNLIRAWLRQYEMWRWIQ